MSYSEAIREGFSVINRNWQLVIIQFVFTVLSCIGFFLVVVLPLAVALVMTGVSPSLLSRLQGSPEAILSRYSGLALAGGVLLFLYILLASVLGLYVFGASAGTLSRAVRDASERFNMKAFFEEGRRCFMPLLGFFAVLGLIAIGGVLLFFLAATAVSLTVAYVQGQSPTLSTFLGVFFALIGLVSGFFAFFGLLSLLVYGVASIVLKGTGAVAAVRETVRYILDRPSAFWLYVLLAVMYLLFTLSLSLIGFALEGLHGAGLILTFLYQLLAYGLQGYAGLFVLSTAFAYYHGTEPGGTGEPS